jgi:methionine--tRNA ligase beta chain
MKKPNIQIDTFAACDMRVGLVKNCVGLENSQKLLELTVDLGEDYGEVTILTGLKAFFQPEDFIGKKFLFMANLEPRPMAGCVSNGMFLALDGEEKPVFIQIPNEVPAGTFMR